MDAFLDNKRNYRNTTIRLRGGDNSALYTLSSMPENRKKPTVTTLRSTKAGSAEVGAINWSEKTIEVGGRKQSCDEIMTRKGERYFWCWEKGGREYQVTSTSDYMAWKVDAIVDGKVLRSSPLAEFALYQPDVGRRSRPATLRLSSEISSDETFLILILIYSELEKPRGSFGTLIIDIVILPIIFLGSCLGSVLGALT